MRMPTKLNILSLTVLLVIVSMVAYSSLASAETYTTIPYYTIYWTYGIPPVEGFFTSLAWSPEGDKIAASAKSFKDGHEWILVLTFEGDTMWEFNLTHESVDSGIGIKWSSDDQRFAISTIMGSSSSPLVVDTDSKQVKRLRYTGIRDLEWNPRDPDLLAIGLGKLVVLVNVSSEEELWRAKIPAGTRVYDIAWSPRGDRIAVNTGNEILFLDSASGEIVARYSPGKEAIESLKWSADGELIAVKQKYGTWSRIVVIDPEGKVKWSTDKGVFRDYAWSPDKPWLVAAEATKIILYYENGHKRWSIPVNKLGLVSYYWVAWSPDGRKILALKNRFVLLDPFIVPEIGGIMWNARTGLPQTVLIGWSKTDRILVLAGTKHGAGSIGRTKIIVFGPAKAYSTLTIKNCPATLMCSLVVSDDKATKTYHGTRSGVLELYATPGEYTLVFSIGVLPREYKVAGTITDLSKYNVTMRLSIKPDRSYTITAPIEKIIENILRGFTRLVVKATPGITLELVKVGAKNNLKYRFKLTNSEETIYVAPGLYIVKYYPENQLEPKVLKTIKARGGETITLSIGTKPIETKTTTSLTKTISATRTSTSPGTAPVTTSTETTYTTSTGTKLNKPVESITTTTTTTTGKKNNITTLIAIAAIGIIVLALIALVTRRH